VWGGARQVEAALKALAEIRARPPPRTREGNWSAFAALQPHPRNAFAKGALQSSCEAVLACAVFGALLSVVLF